MGGDLVVNVDHLIKPEAFESVQKVAASEAAGESAHNLVSSTPPPSAGKVKEDCVIYEEEEPLIQTVECRICQEEDDVKDLETPCACSGSLKYAHRRCVQRWCNEKGDIICEICHEAYKPGYTAHLRAPPNETTIDISGGWTDSDVPLNLHEIRLLAMATARHHFLENEYDDYAPSDASGAAFCRSAALILMALLLLRHASIITNGDGDDDGSAAFSLFLLWAAGFLLPFYIMAWAISILQHRRQRQEAAALVATDVAVTLETGQGRGLQFTVTPNSLTVEPHE